MAWGKWCGTAALLLLVATGGAWGQSPRKTKVADDSKEDLKQAQQLANRGDAAYSAGQLNEALADYEQAVKHAPGDAGIVRRAAMMRAQVVQKLVEQAENDALDGFVVKATDLMYEALRIDPGNAIVAERLAQMKQMPKEILPRGDKEDYELRGATALKPQLGKKTVNVRGDSKTAYEQVAEMYGITVTFDPELTSKNIKLRVNDVDFYTAMELLGAESKTFYRVVNSTLILVAEDTIAKRREYTEEVEQTFRLDNTVAPEDLTEMVRVIREITNSTHITTDTKNHSLTVRESADKVALAGQLIKELEQSRRDVMLDIDLLEVDRNTARSLGITPPSNVQAIPLNSREVAQLEQATDIANLLTLVSQVFAGRGITASATDVLPVGGGKTTFLLTMPSASATFSDRVVAGKERAADLDARARWQGRDILRGATISGDFVAAVDESGRNDVGGAVSSTVFARTDFAVGNGPVAVVDAGFQQRCEAGSSSGESSGQFDFDLA